MCSTANKKHSLHLEMVGTGSSIALCAGSEQKKSSAPLAQLLQQSFGLTLRELQILNLRHK